MWKTRIILLAGFLFSLNSFAQYGNEWIDFNQRYFTFKIGKDDFYRITRDELQAAGFPVASIPASRIQLFREGKEVALNVSTSSDNTIDYLEFYGKRRDGTSDTPLYLEGTQPHTYFNLFSDSATYFLSYRLGSESGKRMEFSSDRNSTGLTPEPYHLQEILRVFSGIYSVGRSVGSNFTLSDYDRGEGFTGGFFRKNQSRTYQYLLNGLSGEGSVIFETVLVGGNNLQHNVEISAGVDENSLESIGNAQFNERNTYFFSEEVPMTSIGSGNELVVNVFDEGFPNQSDRVSVAYSKVVFPQEISIGNGLNKVFALDNISQRKGWLQIATTNASDLRAFDITDPFNAVRLSTTSFSDRLEVVVSDVRESNKIIAVSNTSSVGAIAEIDFPDYSLSDKNYLIITHPLLRSPEDPVEEYKVYRESEEGGNHNVQIANIDDLYNLFNYGDPSPLAISKFIRYANILNPVKNVFIIGKGNSTNRDSFRRNDPINVPTYGVPGSDLMYVLGVNADPRIPGVPIGRLNATNATQITSYLNKIKEMEFVPYDDLFRKDFLQLSGGANAFELNSFVRIIDEFSDIAENDFIGGRTFNTSKQTSEAVKFIDISDRVNQGVGYITFFGHSSGTLTDIEVGIVSDPSFGFANKGKYPIFLVNGCDAGGIFGGNLTFGEDWILEPDLGAVNFIAHTSAALSSTLRKWSNLFYSIGFGDEEFIGKSVGEVIIEVANQYRASDQSDIGLTQIRQMQLQGDPAYRIFGADHPDYQLDNNAITAKAIEANEILALQDSFKLEIVVKNFGLTTRDSLLVQVDRTFGDGSQQAYQRTFKRPLRQDTLSFNIPIDNGVGINLFTILLDPENEIEELDESNNAATINVTIFSGNTVNLFPLNFGVVPESNVEFVWQSSGLLEEDRSYDLEFDTNPDFSGSNRRSFTVDGEILLKQKFDFSTFSLEDTTTIYWRTKFSNPDPNESDRWVESSFTLIDNSAKGWGQYTNTQLSSGNITGLNYNESANRWEFMTSSTSIEFFITGANNTEYTQDDLKAIVGGINLFVTSNANDPECSNNTFNVIAFDRQTGFTYNPIEIPGISVLSSAACGRLPQRIYQFKESLLVSLDSRFEDEINFPSIVDAMDDGDQLIMFNIGNVNYSGWAPEIIAYMNQMGVSSSTIASLTDGQPVIFLGKKGDPEGSAIVVMSNGSTDPITEQSIVLEDEVIASFNSGSFRSSRVGPANSWESFSYKITKEFNDSFILNLFGITSDGISNELFSNARAETVNVSSIDALQYPRIELSLSFEDETDQTPPQLNFWQVNYEQPADGLLTPVSKEQIKIQEGEEITTQMRFVNTSPSDFADSLSVMATLINQNTGAVKEMSTQIAPPASNDTTVFDVAFPSINMSGLNNLIVEVSANENEIYTSNNRVTLADLIEVKSDETNPIIDVTFDGFHILNGDVVSPNPAISVRMRDDNQLLYKEDTTGFNISLRLPGESSQYQRISFSDPRLQFTPASESQDFKVDFRPGPLEDGTYGLRILAEDESGNSIREVNEPYEVTFEIVNESTITHFYPYPNPFSTNCRFVFTLTGSEVPSELKIQIMTVSGRVVREITQDEIGPIRIGNNITSYAWDGRDHYGDQLANGVYFYKVFLNGDGDDFAHRFTSGDRAFKNGFGKLYILR